MAGKKSKIINSHFAKVAGAFARDPSVSQGKGIGFGNGELKVRGKIFAMVASKGEFVVRLPKERAGELVDQNRAEYWEPRPGVKMKEWVVVPIGKVSWIDVAQEARRHVEKLAI